MKKTIATLAMLVSSSSAMALMEPSTNPNPVLQTICMKTNKMQDGSKVAGCDEARNNKELGLALKDNGCAKDQIAIMHYGEVSIESCLPPGFAQL